MQDIKRIAIISFMMTVGTASAVQAVNKCSEIFNTPLFNQLVDDSDKPQHRSWARRENGVVTFDTSEIIKNVEAHVPVSERSRLYMTVFINGIEQPQQYAWGTRAISIKEPALGQIDYYVVVKEKSAEQGKPDQRIMISDLNIRETHDSQNVEGLSFAEFLTPERELDLKIPDSLRARGLQTSLTQKAIEKGYGKVVWVLRQNAEARLVNFVNQATKGVSVFVQMNKEGVPTSATLTDRATGEKLQAGVENFYFKVDAAFNGNAFFWDDMLVSLATISHHPWLVRSTLDFWLSVQKMNHGVIPREVRKGNLKSLWFDMIVRPGEGETANLQYTNPYLMHWVAEKLVAADPSPENLQLMKQVVSSMEDYTAWMEKNRAVYDHGEFLGFTMNALGSGLDNSRGGRGNDHSADSYQSGWVDALAQQISMYKSVLRWHRYFSHHGMDEKPVEYQQALQKKIESLENLLNTKYWNQELGFYFDVIPDGHGGFQQDTKYFSVAGFWPLFSGSANQKQVSTIVSQQLTADRFGGHFPFPANSSHALKLDPNEDGYWNSDARWPSMATVAIEGLRTSGRPDVAYEMSVRFLRSMIEANPETVAEFYGLANKLDPAHGKGRVGEHAGHTTRLDFAGWGKVPPVYLMLEHIIGLSPKLDGRLAWNVMMPMKIGETIEIHNYIYKDSLIKKISLQKSAENQFYLEIESEKPVEIDVESFRDSRDQLVPRGHAVQVISRSI